MVRDWWVQAELKTHSQSAAGLNRLRISIHRVPTMIFDFPSDPTSPATYVFESWNIIGSCWIIHHYVWYTQMKFYLVSLTTWYDAPTQVTIPLQIIFSALWDEEQLWLQNRLGGNQVNLKMKKVSLKTIWWTTSPHQPVTPMAKPSANQNDCQATSCLDLQKSAEACIKETEDWSPLAGFIGTQVVSYHVIPCCVISKFFVWYI